MAMKGAEKKAPARQMGKCYCRYSVSGEEEGGGVLTLSKLSNRSDSREAWHGAEGAKGSGTVSLAGREEVSSEPCDVNIPRL